MPFTPFQTSTSWHGNETAVVSSYNLQKPIDIFTLQDHPLFRTTAIIYLTNSDTTVGVAITQQEAPANPVPMRRASTFFKGIQPRACLATVASSRRAK